MLLARMAEAVYWAGRHLERAEGTARIVQVHTDAHVDLPVGEDVGWEPLLAIAGVDSEFAERYAAAEDLDDVRAAEEDVDRVPPPRRGQRLVDPGLADRGPREPPHGAAGHPPGGLGGLQQPVAREQRPPRGGPLPRGPGPLAAPGHRRVPVHPRDPARHHEPGRGHVVPGPGPEHRAGRPDHPGARRPLGLAPPTGRRRPLRRRPLDGRPPLAGRLPALPPGHAGPAPGRLDAPLPAPGRPLPPRRGRLPDRGPGPAQVAPPFRACPGGLPECLHGGRIGLGGQAHGGWTRPNSWRTCSWPWSRSTSGSTTRTSGPASSAGSRRPPAGDHRDTGGPPRPTGRSSPCPLPGGHLRRAPRGLRRTAGGRRLDPAPVAPGGRGAGRLRRRGPGVPARRVGPAAPQRGGHLQRGRRRRTASVARGRSIRSPWSSIPSSGPAWSVPWPSAPRCSTWWVPTCTASAPSSPGAWCPPTWSSATRRSSGPAPGSPSPVPTACS